jgi:hypothetical protein
MTLSRVIEFNDLTASMQRIGRRLERDLGERYRHSVAILSPQKRVVVPNTQPMLCLKPWSDRGLASACGSAQCTRAYFSVHRAVESIRNCEGH